MLYNNNYSVNCDGNMKKSAHNFSVCRVVCPRSSKIAMTYSELNLENCSVSTPFNAGSVKRNFSRNAEHVPDGQSEFAALKYEVDVYFTLIFIRSGGFRSMKYKYNFIEQLK